MNKRWSAVHLLILAIVFTLAGCRSKRAAFSSDIKMSDRASERQLLAGFHDLEQKKWRWTKRLSAVVLQPPIGSERYGATLRVNLFISSVSIRTLGPITLSAQAEDIVLSPETFAKEGTYSYSRKIPAALFRGKLLPVVLTFDKAIVPPDPGARELAAVVDEVALELNK